MPNRIKVLSELVANKIAAGEVVERPASVVKELLENSLDASATDISIDIKAGGKRYIRLQDNGLGMSRDDSLLAFERFGTSKIEKPSDLDAISSLGFRGEALASIASVSQVKLRTRQRDDDVGTLVVIEGGILKTVEDVGCPVGTIMEVANLFFNTPARRAFMASTETEFFWIAQTVMQYALCRRDVRFALVHNGRKTIDVAIGRDLRDRIAAVLGPELLKQLVSISAKSDLLSLEGYLGLPTRATTGGRRLQSIFVNGRAASSMRLVKAIYDGYSPYLMRGRHPALVLFLVLDPGRVNVNVHPTKRQVRFMDESRVTRFAKDAISESLGKALRGPVVEVSSRLRSAAGAPLDEGVFVDVDETEDTEMDGEVVEHSEEPLASRASHAASSSGAHRHPASQQHEQRGAQRIRRPIAGGDSPGEARGAANMPQKSGQQDIGDRTQDIMSRATPPGQPGLFAERLVPVGQIDNSFIIAQGGGAVVILDQHAAHERIMFEKFMEHYRLGNIPVQRLLMPIILDVPPAMHSLLLSGRSTLQKLGVEVDDFGGGSVAVKSKPALLSDEQVTEIIMDIGEILASSKDTRDASFRPVEEVCALFACKAAVKAGQALSFAEMRELLDQLAKTDRPMACPHGRPTTVELDLDDLKRSFLRTL
ncbi:DNA mismatch repair endonuclease MutL [bacterium]|nr:DNA mismatch repair endonuclease MutL [bacterium]